jgi:hypothetical protein
VSAAAPDRAPRVVVEPSDTVLHNHGDAAMLQVALDRLRTELPTARIEVFTEEPSGCSLAARPWCRCRSGATRRDRQARRAAPAAPRRPARALPRWRAGRVRPPDASRALARWGLALGGGDAGGAPPPAAARTAGPAGMGGLTDVFRFAAGLLDSIEHAPTPASRSR